MKDSNNNQLVNNNTTPNNRRTRQTVSKETRLSLVRSVCDNSMSIKQAAELYFVSYENAKKIIRNFKRGCVINKKKKGKSEKSKLSHDMLEKIETIVSNNPAYTLKQIIDEIKLTESK
ncbi:hypothetical protein CDIK_2520 [Cucumispora dikerogammari]|nr:hypothetical protein CDIK_2520 [Cucumispora dikerogammari]